MTDRTYCSKFWELYDTYMEAVECNDDTTAAEYSEKMREHRRHCKICPKPLDGEIKNK